MLFKVLLHHLGCQIYFHTQIAPKMIKRIKLGMTGLISMHASILPSFQSLPSLICFMFICTLESKSKKKTEDGIFGSSKLGFSTFYSNYFWSIYNHV